VSIKIQQAEGKARHH